MNCPGACIVYGSERRSYRDLPLRLAEFGLVSRNEREGVLHGLLRVRAFTQDDAHIFCTPDQIMDEVESICQAIDELYARFGFDQVRVELSTRPDRYIGSDDQWDRAEASLREVLERQDRDYEISPGEGTFYGPKIDFHITDALGRSWQCGTCQLDFQFPERFELTYQGEDNAEHRPVMIHRALLGSMERFVGHPDRAYAGRFPVWLAPVQAAVLPVADRHARLRRASSPASSARPGWGARRRPLGVGRAQDSRCRAAKSRTCWWSASAKEARRRRRCARTTRATWGDVRRGFRPTVVEGEATRASRTLPGGAGPHVPRAPWTRAPRLQRLYTGRR